MLVGGGPGGIGPAGAPLIWTTLPIPYTTDGGALGKFDNAAANTRVAQMFGVWQAVPTSTVAFTRTGPISPALVPDGDVDTVAEFDALVANCPGNPIIYDRDGSLFANLGLPSGVLGFAGPCAFHPQTGAITAAVAAFNGDWIDGDANDGRELTDNEFDGVLIHEFGHLLGLDHSQINVNCLSGTCSADDASGLPTMFPFSLPGVEESPGIPPERTLASDDIAWASYLYPDPSFAATTGTIRGEIFFPDGVTGLQGANVVARQVDDLGTPIDESRRVAVSVVSGFLFTGNPGNALVGNTPSEFGSRDPSLRGSYVIPGLSPGTYRVEIESVYAAFVGGSSVGPMLYQIPLPGLNEFYSVPESATDDPSSAADLSVSAMGELPGINIIVNAALATQDTFDATARNDTRASATPISPGTHRASLSPYPDVDFYSFTARAGVPIVVEISSSRPPLDTFMDSVLEIVDSSGTRLNTCRTADNPSGPFAQPCLNDDNSAAGTFDSFLEFSALTDGTYFIHVSEYRGDARPDFLYDLVVSAPTPPPNDDFASAKEITSIPFTDTVNTRGATIETSDPTPACAAGAVSSGRAKSVWYRFTPSSSGALVADTFGSGYDTILSVWTGTQGSLSAVTCNDQAGSSDQSQVGFTAQAGTTYYFLVTAYSGDGGLLVFNLRATTPPPNDNFANAAVITNLAYTNSVDTVAATIEPADPTPNCLQFAPVAGGRGKSVWYRFTPSQNVILMADTLGSSYDTILTVVSGAQAGPIVACSDDSVGVLSSVTFNAAANTTYYFMVSAFNDDGGLLAFHLNFSTVVVPTVLSLPANDLIFDTSRQRIYASVPSSAGPGLANTVTVIDPESGAVGPSVFVGSEPGKLALSDDGQFLYVGLNGAAAVRRVDLTTMTAGLQFALGSDSFLGLFYPQDIEVQPGNPQVVAVSRRNQGFSPSHEGVAIYDNGVQRPSETPGHTGSNVIEFGSSASRLYGYNNETTEFGFRRMTVDASGVTVLDTTQNLIVGGGDIEFDAARIYASSGAVIDPEPRTLLGTFAVGGSALVRPDSAVGRTFFLTGSGPTVTLKAFDQTTFTPAGNADISGISGYPVSLIRWGLNGFAFCTSGGQVVLFRTSLVPAPLVNPVPVLTALAPVTGGVGSSDFTLTVLGGNFIPSSIVRWNGSDRPTTFVHGALLRATISAADVASVGTAQVTVFNPAPGGGVSGALTFIITLTNPSPSLSSISPSMATPGGAAFTLTVTGSEFVAGSNVRWQGADRPTSFVAANQLAASISAADIAVAGMAQITVFNPAPGGGVSNPLTFTIAAPGNPVPVLTSISPSSALVGDPGFTLTVNGIGFASGATVRWNGGSRPTTFASSTQLTASISTADLAAMGSALITVLNPAPGGGTSNFLIFPIVRRVSLQANDIVYDPGTQQIYASVPSVAGPQLGNSVTSLDPRAGTLGNSVFVGSEPNRLALTDNHQFLYVGLDGAAAVRRIDLPTQTAGPQFSLGSDPFFGPYTVEDMEALPGNPLSVAISRMNRSVSPRHAGVAVFDDGVQRPTTTPRHTGSNSITFSASASTLYGYNNETTEFGFRRMALDASGVAVIDATPNMIQGFGVSIEFDAGRVYASNGPVVDPSGPGLAGRYVPVGFGGFVRPDSAANRTFFLMSSPMRILAFDQTTFTLVQSISLSGNFGFPRSFLRWGTNGFAFHTDTGHIFLMELPIVPSPNPVPGIASLSPSTGDVGGPGLLLMVNGSNFVPGSVVRWNGADRATTFVNSSQLQASILPSDLAAVGTAQVTVFNPPPAGGLSNAVTFPIVYALPVLTALTPNGVSVGGGNFTLTVHGDGFAPLSVVTWNGADRATTFVSRNVLTAEIPSTDIVAVGTAQIAVVNPAPGGGTSNALAFSIFPPPVVSLNTSTVYFTATMGAAAPMPRGVSVTEAVGQSVPWTASVDQPWVTLLNSSGSTPGLIRLGVNPAGLAAGTHMAQLRVQSPSGAFTERTAMVVLVLNEGLIGDVERSIPASQNRVDGYDLIRLGRAFGATLSSPNWDPAVNLVDTDRNGNGVIDPDEMVIDAADLAELARNFGKP